MWRQQPDRRNWRFFSQYADAMAAKPKVTAACSVAGTSGNRNRYPINTTTLAEAKTIGGRLGDVAAEPVVIQKSKRHDCEEGHMDGKVAIEREEGRVAKTKQRPAMTRMAAMPIRTALSCQMLLITSSTTAVTIGTA